jgi:hypothetical protein
MFDRIFSAALAFCVLAGGTLAVGSAMLEQPTLEVQVVKLPRVEINGRASAKLAQAEQAGQADTQSLQ